jgi:hypothetical protein
VKAVDANAARSATFANMRPGKYYAAAFRGITMDLAKTRGFLDLIAPDAVKIEIPVNGQVNITAPLISDEKIKAAEQKVP